MDTIRFLVSCNPGNQGNLRSHNILKRDSKFEAYSMLLAFKYNMENYELKRITMENVANAIQCYLSKFPPKSIFVQG